MKFDMKQSATTELYSPNSPLSRKALPKFADNIKGHRMLG